MQTPYGIIALLHSGWGCDKEEEPALLVIPKDHARHRHMLKDTKGKLHPNLPR